VRGKKRKARPVQTGLAAPYRFRMAGNGEKAREKYIFDGKI